MEQLEEKIEYLKQEVENLEKEVDKLEDELSDAKDKIDSLQSHIERMEDYEELYNNTIEKHEGFPEIITMNDERKRDIINEHWSKYTPEQLEKRLK